jgi:hypothetical protein
MTNPELKNYEQIERLEALLKDLRADPPTTRETASIREIGLEIAIAIREVGAMLVNVGWEQSYAAEHRTEQAKEGRTPPGNAESSG